MFRRLHVYTVHINPAVAKPYEDAKFVEEGFSIKAFIFSFVWALYYRLWWPAFAIFIANMMILQLTETGTLNQLGSAVVQMGLNLIIGFEGNEWHRKKLARQGFITTDIVTGDSLTRAEQRFYDHYFTSANAT